MLAQVKAGEIVNEVVGSNIGARHPDIDLSLVGLLNFTEFDVADNVG